jgi:hypothetical protein
MTVGEGALALVILLALPQVFIQGLPIALDEWLVPLSHRRMQARRAVMILLTVHASIAAKSPRVTFLLACQARRIGLALNASIPWLQRVFVWPLSASGEGRVLVCSCGRHCERLRRMQLEK